MNTEDLKDSAGLAANGAPVSRCPFSPLVRGWPLLGNTRDFLRDTNRLSGLSLS